MKILLEYDSKEEALKAIHVERLRAFINEASYGKVFYLFSVDRHPDEEVVRLVKMSPEAEALYYRLQNKYERLMDDHRIRSTGVPKEDKQPVDINSISSMAVAGIRVTERAISLMDPAQAVKKEATLVVEKLRGLVEKQQKEADRSKSQK